VGGGFVLDEDEAIRNAPALDLPPIPFPFTSGADLMAIGETTGLSIAQIMLANELALRSPSEVDAGLDELADTMAACIDRGCAQTGTLPGGLKVRRRAASLSKELADRQQQSLSEPLAVLDWINLWAMAVNEENAAGGRVVTAPTKGGGDHPGGPALLRAVLSRRQGRAAHVPADGGGDWRALQAQCLDFRRGSGLPGRSGRGLLDGGGRADGGAGRQQCPDRERRRNRHGTQSGPDLRSGGWARADPCIERNAMGAVKAIDASRLALLGDGQHMVSLDKVIETMRQTGADMRDKYKETSQGGLAVNVVEC
jgi:L-serine dehydratase